MNLPQPLPSKLNATNEPNAQDQSLPLARASLQHLLDWQAQHPASLQAQLQPELDQIKGLLDKLEHNVIQIAVFGLVSRGKSAVLNALCGQPVFQTGPLNGVTQWPRSIRWLSEAAKTSHVQIELIDTPGLDEVNGQGQAQMAQAVVRQADLILFVIAGDITQTEHHALVELREAQKPLLLVFNKIDLYPDVDRQVIYSKLEHQRLQQLLSVNEIVMTAADPLPLQVRVEWPDGRTSYEWESPPPNVDDLKHQLLQILNREGQALLSLNVLRQARQVERAIAQKKLALQAPQAEALVWQLMQWKAVVIGLNPVGWMDVLGGLFVDLVLVRSLARLYGLPITHHEAGTLWKTILLSTGGLIVSEVGSSLILGWSQNGAFLSEGLGGVSSILGTAIAQAGLASYGLYRVSQAAQFYLAQGYTWSKWGSNTMIQRILNQLDPAAILRRIQQELQEELDSQ